MSEAAACITSKLDLIYAAQTTHDCVEAGQSQRPSSATSLSPWVVLKFGGTSVSSAANWATVAAVLRERLADGLRPVLVHSALAGVTDKLEQLVVLAPNGNWQSVMEQIEEQHHQLAHELGLAIPSALQEQLECLRQVAAGIALIGECSERLRARVLAHGELLATRLGAAFLNARGITAEWVDVRTVLAAHEERNATARSKYLSATCAYQPDESLQQRWSKSGTVWITQGFIASDAAGNTVLLGRDGSDISASYLAAKLQARRLEIWTDVPGMFSANPRTVPTARLLRSLGYNEAHEIASTGAKVLHPRCITPVKQYGIPLHVYGTNTPTLAGTVITTDGSQLAEQVRAVTIKKNITLLSLENAGTCNTAGFLANALQIFQAHGISAELLSTGATSATVSVDAATNTLDGSIMDSLLHDLAKICSVRVLKPCAAVSLVGRNLHTILHRLGEALAVLEEQRLYLVTQAANGSHVKLWIDEAQGDWLLARLHDSAVCTVTANHVLGPTWDELHAAEHSATLATASPARGACRHRAER